MRAPDSPFPWTWLCETASAAPDRPAVISDAAVVSFGRLHAESGALSAWLARRGVARGDRIALVLPRIPEAITAVFASMSLGAVYVPVQPAWPRELAQFAIEDCAARIVIACENDETIILDRRDSSRTAWRDAILRPSARPAVPPAEPGDPAFILFTSGSTGRPKGVVISCRAVAAFVKWSASEFGIVPEDRIACPSPLGFDLSTFDIFNMALRGAACVLVSDSVSWMPRFLTRLVDEQRISVWYSVPSILSGMLSEGGLGRQPLPRLRVVLFAGEVFPAPRAARLRAALPGAVCTNLYGPTETNVVSWYPLGDTVDVSRSLPIGQACPYADLVTDPSSGELLAGGDSLMNGYWNRPEESERAFVTLEGRRYYRTGDRVTEDNANVFTFLGRLDRQVKRRGYRIELGEIEAALARVGEVVEAAVVSCSRGPHDVMLTAFVRRKENASEISIRTACAAWLPPYMMPDRVVLLEAIPKGDRGKIDYEALKRLAMDQAL